ncbi:hypothetical protein QQG55_34230 [Brugia pahangi]
MTVKYNLAVSTSRPWTLFKLLFRWRGSVWKSVTFELVIWLLLYFTIGIIYRKMLSPQQIRSYPLSLLGRRPPNCCKFYVYTCSCYRYEPLMKIANKLKTLIEFVAQETFYEWSREENGTKRHAGVLALSAIVQAFPYSVPSFLPKILMQLCRHTCDKQPMQDTVKKALSEFKRTHQDNWHEHKMQFSEDQLSILTDLFVSPNYYV